MPTRKNAAEWIKPDHEAISPYTPMPEV